VLRGFPSRRRQDYGGRSTPDAGRHAMQIADSRGIDDLNLDCGQSRKWPAGPSIHPDAAGWLRGAVGIDSLAEASDFAETSIVRRLCVDTSSLIDGA